LKNWGSSQWPSYRSRGDEKIIWLSKIKKIKISLDGGNAETNDSIRLGGTFNKVIRIFPNQRDRKVRNSLHVYGYEEKFKNLPTLFKLCQDLSMDGLIIERFIPW